MRTVDGGGVSIKRQRGGTYLPDLELIIVGVPCPCLKGFHGQINEAGRGVSQVGRVGLPRRIISIQVEGTGVAQARRRQ
jgi:hypothetical protein